MWFIKDKTTNGFFKEKALDVVEWNRIAHQGKHIFSPVKCGQQYSYVKEEFKELVEAFVSKNKAEFLKELCDVFVVLSYYNYLAVCGDIETTEVFDYLPENNEVKDIDETLDEIVLCLHFGRVLFAWDKVCTLLSSLDADYKGALCAVLKNNWSKFPAKSHVQGEDLIEAMKLDDKYSGRYKYITPVTFENFVIFRTDGGKGKIVKPLGFKELKTEDMEKFIYATT